MDKPQLFLDFVQVAGALGLSEHQVRLMIKRGELPAKSGRGVLLDDLLRIEPKTHDTLLIKTGQASIILRMIPQAVREIADAGMLTFVQSAAVIGRHRRYRFCEVMEFKAKLESTRRERRSNGENGNGNTRG